MVAGAVVVADAAVEDGSGGELVDVGVFPFAAGGVVDARDGGCLGRAVVSALVVAVASLVDGLAVGVPVAGHACVSSRCGVFFRAGGGCAAGRVRRGGGCADVVVDCARLLGGTRRCLGGVVCERVVRFLAREGGEEFVGDGGCRVDAVVLVVFFFLDRVACVCFLARAASGDAGGGGDGCSLGALERVADDGCAVGPEVGVNGFPISVCEPREAIVDVALEPVLVGCSLLGVDVDDGALGEFVNVLRVGSPAGCGGGERAEWSCCHAVFFLSCLFACCSCALLFLAYGITCSVACPGGRARVYGWVYHFGVWMMVNDPLRL